MEAAFGSRKSCDLRLRFGEYHAPDFMIHWPLAAVIRKTEALTGCPIERTYVDKGYRGHDTPNLRRVFISGRKCGVHGIIKRELRRRSAIEPVIGHMRSDGHLGRNFLKGYAGDQANAVLTAVGHYFRLILAWLRLLVRLILATILESLAPSPRLRAASTINA
jgi:transposase, IS5 family